MSSSSVFTAQIAEFCAKAKENADLVLRKVALEMFTRVVIKSPVDEGRFKSSWVVSINSVSSEVPTTVDKSGAPSIARINATVPLTKIGDVITMTSNLAYSRRLEYGWSKQAPEGMVRLTIVEFQGIVTQAAATLPQ